MEATPITKLETMEHYRELQRRLRNVQRYARRISPGDHNLPGRGSECELLREVSKKLSLIAAGID